MTTEITRSDDRVSVQITRNGLSPTNFEELWRIAAAVSRSGMAPRDFKNPEQVFVAIAHGLEIGLKPMQALQRIAVINGRPTIWGDAMIGLVRASGQLEKMSETFEGAEGTTGFRAVCVVKRRDSDEVRTEFSVADAKTAGLWGKSGPWSSYPKRMLQMRARSLALRDLFADVLGGLYMAEEVQDMAPPQPEGTDERSDRMTAGMRRVANTAAPQQAAGSPVAAFDGSGAISTPPDDSDAAGAIVGPVAGNADEPTDDDLRGQAPFDPDELEMF